MKKRYLFTCLVLMGLVLVGCDTNKTGVAPNRISSDGIARDRTETNVTWRWIDATHIEKTYWISGRDIHGQTVNIGPITIKYICDYPMSSYGPPAPGHCYSDGSGCVDR